jgi:hypothetical protein
VADEPCPICGGSGWIPVDDLHVKECRCKKKGRMRAHLSTVNPAGGDEIALAPTILTSPLFTVADGQLTDDLTSKNILIESSWNALLPHLKLALVNKGLSFYTRIVTDEMIKRVFVGSTHYQNKSREDRDRVGYFNCLDDLMGEVCDLVIVRFGVMQYKNRSAAGAVHEALVIRQVLRKPTWLVSTPSLTFEDCHAYSPELGTYVERRFKRISLDSSAYPDDVDMNMLEDSPGMSIVEDEEPPHEELALVKEPIPGAPSEEDDMSDILGGGSKYKTKKKYGKTKSSGGGPLG